MKYSFAVIALLFSCLTLGTAAQPTAAPAAAVSAGPARIGVIAFQQAVTQTNEFQRNYADLQKKYDPKRQHLKTLNDEIDALKKQLQTQGAALSDADRESRATNIDAKEKELQRDADDDQNDFKQDMQETFNGVATKVDAVLVDYAEKHGFTVVLDGSEEQTPIVM
ncbi:MAG: OmpH family outer membrane protein [Terracidiphilus sp.]